MGGGNNDVGTPFVESLMDATTVATSLTPGVSVCVCVCGGGWWWEGASLVTTGFLPS